MAQIHKWNADLLLTSEDEKQARELYPRITGGFIDKTIGEQFKAANDIANDAKKRRRLAGLVAVIVGVGSLILISISVTIHETNHSTPSIHNDQSRKSNAQDDVKHQDGGSLGENEEHAASEAEWHLADFLGALGVLLGLLSVAIGLNFVLHSQAKKDWLINRWITERTRQFYFQYCLCHLEELLSEDRDDVEFSQVRRENYVQQMFGGVIPKSPIEKNKLKERLERTIDVEESNSLAWLSDNQPEFEKSLDGFDKFSEFCSFYRDLRLGHQISYAEHVLGKRRGPLRFSLEFQHHVAEYSSMGTVFVIVILHLFLSLGLVFPNIGDIVSGGTVLIIHVLCICLAVITMGIRVVEDGSLIRADLVRYADYLSNLRLFAADFDRVFAQRCAAQSAEDRTRHSAELFSVMTATEELVFVEMTSFLRSAERSSYLM